MFVELSLLYKLRAGLSRRGGLLFFFQSWAKKTCARFAFGQDRFVTH